MTKKSIALMVAVLLLFAACSSSTVADADITNSGSSVVSEEIAEPIELDLDSSDYIDWIGSSKREIAEKYNISDYENEDTLTVKMSYNDGEFKLDGNFRFEDGKLDSINFNFDISKLTDDDILYIYNKIYKSLEKYYGSTEETIVTSDEEYSPYKSIARYWSFKECTVFISHHYWDRNYDPETLSLSYRVF